MHFVEKSALKIFWVWMEKEQGVSLCTLGLAHTQYLRRYFVQRSKGYHSNSQLWLIHLKDSFHNLKKATSNIDMDTYPQLDYSG